MSDIPYKLNQTVLGDCREVLRGFPYGFFDCVVTSPPYWNLRDYTKGNPNEIGREPTPQLYIDNLLKVFAVVKSRLNGAGSVWVNIGDCYHGGGPLMIPQKFAMQMQERLDFKLVNIVIWYKLDAMAESTQRRFSQKYEIFYWFVKNMSDYYFNLDAAKIPVKATTVARLDYKFNKGKSQDISRMKSMLGDMSHKIDMYLEKGVSAGDVWAMPTNKVRVDHAAPYPVYLCVRPIVSTCPPGGIVLDPFSGSGTTGVATLSVGGNRKYFGVDIDIKAVEEGNDDRLAPLIAQPSLF